ncbi:Transcription factor IIIA [Halotydeus destructor]|nr:Transcription factor IIIA [Halotydeus destructor]
MDVEVSDRLDAISTASSSKSKFICPYPDCDAVYSKNCKLNDHIRSHTGERPYICDIEGCDKAFTSRTLLVKHQKRPHSPSDVREKKSYVCAVCDKDFKMKYNLKMHMTTHTGEKFFGCDKCDLMFISRPKLRRHQKVHEMYKCSVDGCKVEVDKWSLLRKHMVTHKTKQKCPKCRKEFANEFHLDEHVKSHDLAFQCAECKALYSTKSNLKAHYKSEHEGLSHKCQYDGCKKEFFHKQSLNLHIKNKHESVEPSQKPKKRIQRRKKAFAVELSGMEAGKDDRCCIMQADKLFRQSNDIVGV